jgi:hypothetical protein
MVFTANAGNQLRNSLWRRGKNEAAARPSPLQLGGQGAEKEKLLMEEFHIM